MPRCPDTCREKKSTKEGIKECNLKSTSHTKCVLLYYGTALCNNAAPAFGMFSLPLQLTLAQSKHRWSCEWLKKWGFYAGEGSGIHSKTLPRNGPTDFSFP